LGRHEPRAYARVHALLARDAPTAVVLRRGPSQSVCTIGWDRRDDTFTLGQWYRGRIYYEKCDISPDGQHWIYFALNGKRHEETKGSYTVLARAPYLKALGLWPCGSTWGGGGLFGTQGDYWPFNREPMIAPPAQPPMSSDFLHSEGWYVGPHNLSRLMRDGWSLVRRPEPGEPFVFVFERDVPSSWVLRRECHIRHEVFELRCTRSGAVVPLPTWEWADLDGERLVWASNGCLWAGLLDRSGVVDPKLLRDFNDMTFHRTRAPY
jgi:hypothetical protein